MARQLNRLTARNVTTIKTPGRHADGGGLYLDIDKGGAKRWVFLYTFGGRRREMGLGGIHTVSLAEARDAALQGRKDVQAGEDPIEARKARKIVPTFGEVADELLASLRSGWSNDKHAYQWEQSLKVHAKPICDKPVNQVTTEDVLSVLKPLWTTVHETASRTRGRIERVLDSAKARGWRAGDNPARWRGHLNLLLPKRQKLTRGHHPALPYADIPAFFVALQAREATAARALEVTILTALRTREALLAERREFDRKARVWAVPPGRMKNKQEHRVPVVDRVQEIVDALAPPKDMAEFAGPWVFLGDGRKHLSLMAMEMLLRRMGQECSVHGFRSTFKDWASDETDHPREVIEAALAHQVGNEVERAYRRGDALEKRRALMADWAAYCLSSSA